MQVANTAALITSGASGLGAATAAALARAGAAVYALDLPRAISTAPAVDGVTLWVPKTTSAPVTATRRS